MKLCSNLVFLIAIGAVQKVQGTPQTDDATWVSVFDDAVNGLISAAYCFDNKGDIDGEIGNRQETFGLVHAKDKDDCLSKGFDWGQRIETVQEFKDQCSLAVPNGQVGIFLGRLKSGSSISALRDALKTSGIIPQDFIYSSDATFVLLSGKQGDFDSIEELDFAQPLPVSWKINPITKAINSSQERSDLVKSFNANKFRVVVSKGRRLLDAKESLLRSSGRNLRNGEEFHVEIEGEDHQINPRSLLVTTPSSLLMELAQDPNTLYVEGIFEKEIMNSDASAITQGYLTQSTDPKQDLSLDKFPLWNAGITGQGQVVGVGDTGLDMESCYFSDPNVDEAANKETRKNSPKGTIHNYPTHSKVIQYYAFADGDEGTILGHGTHVAGSVAGFAAQATGLLDAAADKFPDKFRIVPKSYPADEFKGMAPDAKIAFFDIGIFLPDEEKTVLQTPGGDYSPMFDAAKSKGARIHTNSWGIPLNFYDSETASVDNYMYDNQDFLILYAAGNAGLGKNLKGIQAPTIGNPGTAKNIITVGASMHGDRMEAMVNELFPDEEMDCERFGVTNSKSSQCAESMAKFSSYGPTFDGRMKPDITAPGLFIASAKSSPSGPTCKASINAGTSMATPVTAGDAALMRQFLMEGRYPNGEKNTADAFTPMGSLLKALFVNGADFMKGTYNGYQLSSNKPDMFQGFGRINLSNNLLVDGNKENGKQVFMDGDFNNMKKFTSSGDTRTISIKVQDGTLTNGLKATLAWSEPGGSPLAKKLLVNDLDIVLKGPNGESIYANGLNSEDRVNTVESIYLEPNSLSAGETYILEISAFAINDGPQPYAIVISGDFKSIDESSQPGSPTPTPTTSFTSFPTIDISDEVESLIGLGIGITITIFVVGGLCTCGIIGLIIWCICKSASQPATQLVVKENAYPQQQQYAI